MEETLDDFIQKYRGTFCFITLGKEDLLTQFMGHDNGENLKFNSKDFGTISVKFANAKNLYESYWATRDANYR